MNELKQICIVGCGLIGGSFALALRRAGFTGKITACGGARSPKIAVERGVVDAVEEGFDRGEMLEADLIYLAAPIGGIIDFLRTRSSQIKKGALVTDAGSTKVEICRAARESLPGGIYFIGGHPMAGSEQAGVEYARADLFDRASYALMVEQGADKALLNRLKSIIETTGARVLLTEPESHDAAVSLISHLPQLVASALASLLGSEHDGDVAEHELAQRLAANGWRDMTRLAGSSWGVWRDVCLTNQPNIACALGGLIAELQSLKDAVDTKDFSRVRELFTAANLSVSEQRKIHYSRFEKV
ncbi:MAG: prephenate dehydrogenase/arogenate dehydrogenase family protein [Acidobacteria bacterium]|nr:prephenate dehydrogenase/arogenate dehydrogenase family protein [Acidobacteriota bacterium]